MHAPLSLSLCLSTSIYINKQFGSRSDRMELRKECLVNLNINNSKCLTLSYKSQCAREDATKYHFQHRWADNANRDSKKPKQEICMQVLVSLSLSKTCFQSLQIVWIQKISHVLPNIIRGKQAYQELIN